MRLIVAAMDSEVTSLIERFVQLEVEPFKLYQGKISGFDYLLVVTGVGKTNAAAGLSYALSKHPNMEIIINLGIVGGYLVELHEAYLVESAMYHDVDVTIFNYKFGQIPGQPEIFLSDINELSSKLNLKTMRLMTGDSFQTSKIDDKPYIIDMEGASLFHVANRFKKPIISLKIVSDVIESKHQLETYTRSEQTLDEKLYQILLKLLEVI